MRPVILAIRMLAFPVAATAAPTLDAGPVLPDHPVAVRVTGAPPRATLDVVVGMPGPGTCLLSGPCLSVKRAQWLGTFVADEKGRATFDLPPIRGVAVGDLVGMQVVTGGSRAEVSNLVELDVLAPRDLCTTGVATPECELLVEINRSRAMGADCGQYGVFAPTHPVVPDARLGRAAEAHAAWMAATGLFSHKSPGGPLGNTFAERIASVGYAYRRVGEVLARGQKLATGAVRGWRRSDGHCRQLHDPRHEDVGVGHATGRRGPWWAAELGQPKG